MDNEPNDWMSDVEKALQKTEYVPIKWDKPQIIAGKVIAIKEFESLFGGGTNRLFVIENDGQKLGFFDSPKSLKKQLEKLKVDVSDVIYVEYRGTDTYNGHTFKSFAVYKYIGWHKWITSNGKEITL